MVTSGAMTRRMARSTRQKISNARRITVTRVSMRQLGRQPATDAEVIDWCAALAVPDVDEETLRARSGTCGAATRLVPAATRRL